MNIKITGLDALRKELEAFSKKVEAVAEEEDLTLEELLPPSFMADQTRFTSLKAMTDASGGCEAPEGYATQKWNAFVSSNTNFGGWREMLTAAAGVRAARMLGL